MSKNEKKDNIVPLKTDMGIFVALDLGATEVRAIAAKKDNNGNFVTVAIASTPSNGIQRGAIQNIEKTKFAISHVLTDLENSIKIQANKGVTDPYELVDVKIEQVYIALNGNSIRTVTNTVNRRLGGNFITEDLMEEFDRENRNIERSGDLEILDIQPLQYLVNDDETSSPVGCRCEVISATYKIILGNANLLSSLRVCLESIGRKLAGYCIAPLAAANATISENEKELGVVVLDFGDSTTNLSIYYKGKMHYTLVIPIGSNIITNDIAQLRIVREEAEKIKKAGNCYLDKTKQDIIVGLSTGKDVSYRVICEVIERRIDLILEYVKLGIQESKLAVGPQLDQIVLLGNASKLRGLKAKIEEKIGLSAHEGRLLDRNMHLVPSEKASNFHVAIGTLLTAKENCAVSTKINERPVEKKTVAKKVANLCSWIFKDELPEENNQKN